jgi:hypothetical protein
MASLLWDAVAALARGEQDKFGTSARESEGRRAAETLSLSLGSISSPSRNLGFCYFLLLDESRHESSASPKDNYRKVIVKKENYRSAHAGGTFTVKKRKFELQYYYDKVYLKSAHSENALYS